MKGKWLSYILGVGLTLYPKICQAKNPVSENPHTKRSQEITSVIEKKLSTLDDFVLDYVENEKTKNPAVKKDGPKRKGTLAPVKLRFATEKDRELGEVMMRVIAAYQIEDRTMLLPLREDNEDGLADAVPHELMHALYHDSLNDKIDIGVRWHEIDAFVREKVKGSDFDKLRYRLALEEEARKLDTAKSMLNYSRHKILALYLYMNDHTSESTSIPIDSRIKTLDKLLGLMVSQGELSSRMLRRKEDTERLERITSDGLTTEEEMKATIESFRMLHEVYSLCDEVALETRKACENAWDQHKRQMVAQKRKHKGAGSIYDIGLAEIQRKRKLHEGILRRALQSREHISYMPYTAIIKDADEMFARAYASLVKQYRGGNDTIHFRLDEAWLAFFSRFRWMGKPMFQKAIEGYRKCRASQETNGYKYGGCIPMYRDDI